jgi:hypothetical protein
MGSSVNNFEFAVASLLTVPPELFLKEPYVEYQSVPTSRGLNNFQLVKVDNKWLIASLTWYDETADLKLPGKYL